MFQTQEADTDEGEEKMAEEDESERDAVGGERKIYVRDKINCTTHETSLCEFHSRTLHRLVCFTSFVKYIVSSRLSFDPHTHSIVLLRGSAKELKARATWVSDEILI